MTGVLAVVVVGVVLVAFGPILICNVRYGAQLQDRRRHAVSPPGKQSSEGELPVPFHSVIEASPSIAPAAAAAGLAGSVIKVAVTGRKTKKAAVKAAHESIDD